MKIRTSTFPLLVAFFAASTAFAPSASAKGQSDQQPPAAPPSGAPETTAPTTAAPSSEPGNAGPAGGPTISISGTTTNETKDEPASEPVEKKERKLPFRGTTLLFDQSMSTQTAHLETDPQLSYVPLYEWWFSLRPRWYFTDKLYFWGRLDLTKEWTNNQETNLYREDVFGDIWLNLVYKTEVPAISKHTKVSAGIRALLPTSKESQAAGMIINPGVTMGAEQEIPLNGESAKVFNKARIGLSAVYNHPFTQATTPVDPNLNYERQSVDGRTFVSDQLTGMPLVEHQITGILDTGVQITPKLGLTLDMIVFDQWHYHATDNVNVAVMGSQTYVPRSADDTLFTQKTWFIASLDYDLFDEVSLGLGYYNLANVLAPNSNFRSIYGGDNIWWSPDARVFFDVTFNIDKFYELALGKDTKPAAPLGQPHQSTSLNQQRIMQTAW